MPMSLDELHKFAAEAPLGDFSAYDMEIMLPELERLNDGDVYLEIGVLYGRSLDFARKFTKQGVEVWGVDLLENPGIEGTNFISGNSVNPNLWGGKKINLLFIDGDHTYEGCGADIKIWFPHLADNSVVMFHDCDESSPGVVWAVSEYVSTHSVKKWEMFKRTDKNTSMAKLQL